MKFHTIKMLVLLGTCVLGILCGTLLAEAKTPTDKQIVKSYCAKHYKGYKIKYFTKWNDKIMLNRKGKKVVYVQKEISYSSGKKDKRNGMYWGYIKGSNYYRTWYNAKVKKGKKVVSYYIYNPKNNYCDDIVAVIDNKRIR